MLFRSPVVRFFSRILNRVTITVVLVALQLLWLCWVAFAITTGTGRVWVNGLLNALSLLSDKESMTDLITDAGLDPDTLPGCTLKNWQALQNVLDSCVPAVNGEE